MFSVFIGIIIVAGMIAWIIESESESESEIEYDDFATEEEIEEELMKILSEKSEEKE